MAVSGVAFPQGGRPASVFYPFGHPTPYACVNSRLGFGLRPNEDWLLRLLMLYSAFVFSLEFSSHDAQQMQTS
jgi:hypothetical protein